MSSESARAVLLGLALGDALGWPVEFLDISAIRARYGAPGISELPDPGIYTDDTQMSIALAEALIESGQADLDTLMGTLSQKFIVWKNDPRTALTAPGTTCIRGVVALENGIPWREAGVKGSKGCGACMRVAPIGYYFQHDADRLKSVARAQAWLTHRHPTADAASVAAAYLVKLALDGVTPQEFLPRVSGFTRGLSEELAAVLDRVAEAHAWENQAALAHIGPTRGGGWIAEEAVAMALFCVLRHPDDFTAALQLAANISGDSDSVACIAGGILGARLGIAGLPATWLARLENRRGLIALADQLAAGRMEALK